MSLSGAAAATSVGSAGGGGGLQLLAARGSCVAEAEYEKKRMVDLIEFLANCGRSTGRGENEMSKDRQGCTWMGLNEVYEYECKSLTLLRS